MFRKNPLDDKLEFIAHGTVLGADADRIVVKRIVLTGYPTRVHKRHAIVKYMFYNPEDVKVQLIIIIYVELFLSSYTFLLKE